MPALLRSALPLPQSFSHSRKPSRAHNLRPRWGGGDLRLAGWQQDQPRKPSRFSSLHVGRAVAKDKRARWVKPVCGASVEDHARPRFAAPVFPPIGANTVHRMVGAKLDRRKPNAPLSEALQHPAGKGMKVGLRVIAPPDPSLVGDDDKSKAERLRSGAEIEDAGQEAEVLDPMHIAEILVDDAIAI